MSVKIHNHPTLSHLTNGREVVEVEGSTVGQCLEQLVSRFPEMKGWLFGKNGKLSNVVEIYVNLKSSYPEELAKPVKDGDELNIILVISGG